MVTTAMVFFSCVGTAPCVRPCGQDAPEPVPVVFSVCRSRRVPVALTPARDPTLAKILHGRD